MSRKDSYLPGPRLAAPDAALLRRQAFGIMKDRGLKGEEAKDALRLRAGVDSLAGLDGAKWLELIRGLGASPAGEEREEPLEKPNLVTAAQWSLVLRLQRHLRWTNDSLEKYCKKYGRVSAIGWLDVSRCRGIITGLMKIAGVSHSGELRR